MFHLFASKVSAVFGVGKDESCILDIFPDEEPKVTYFIRWWGPGQSLDLRQALIELFKEENVTELTIGVSYVFKETLSGEIRRPQRLLVSRIRTIRKKCEELQYKSGHGITLQPLELAEKGY
jgi:hypothetical protein